MIIVHVFIHVKSEYIEEFKAATIDNAKNSLMESGILRFDVVQQADDPTRFVLIEIYRSQDDISKHKETKHYDTWRDTVEKMMAEPRYSIRYSNVFPDETRFS